MTGGTLQQRVIWALIATGLAAAIMMAISMTHGAGISPDSVIYLGVAESIRHGRGFFFDGGAVTHFPPGYPLMLAAVASVTGDVGSAARIVASGWFGANIALVGWAVFAVTRRTAASVIAILLFGLSSSVLLVHAMAWTEAPFFWFTLAGVLLLSHWSVTRRRATLLLAAAMFASAMLMRYVGVTVLAPLGIAVLFLGQRSLRQRAGDTLTAFTVALAPLAAWMLRDRIVAQQATDRVWAVHLVDSAVLGQMVSTLNDFLWPIDIAFELKMALVILAAGVVAAAVGPMLRRARTPAVGDAFCVLSAGFGAAYLAFLLLSISFLDATTPLDDRILFPLFGMIVVTLVVLASRTQGRHARIWWTFEALALASLLVRLSPAADAIRAIRSEGIGYASETWHNSPMLARVRALSPAIQVYSDAQDAIEFLLGRDAQWLPDDRVWESMTPNPAFAAQRAAMCHDVLDGTAIVAYFNTEDPDDEWALDQTAKLCPFATTERAEDGALYFGPPAPNRVHTGT